MLDTFRREAERHQKAIVDLQTKKASEAAKAAQYAKRAADAVASAQRSSSTATAKTKLREAERHEKTQQGAAKKVADYEKKIAEKQKQLSAAQGRIAKEEARLARQQEQKAKSQALEQERRSQEIAREIESGRSRDAELDQRLARLESLPERIVVLFLAANPLNADQLRLDEEARAIAQTIRSAKHRDAVTLESCWAIRPPDVLLAINEYEPTIVHFSGHGTDDDEIVFQDEFGESKLVSKDAIVQLMAASSGKIRLVVFNTCFSESQAEAVVDSVDAAIGMTSSVSDDTARTFAAQLYSGIGFGLSLHRSFEQAKALVMMEGLDEHEIPRLFMASGLNAEDIFLVKPPEPEGTQSTSSNRTILRNAD